MSSNHSTLLKVIEYCTQGIPKTSDVIEDDTFLMIADGMRRSDCEHFVERADATRQCHYHIAMCQQQILPVAEVVTWNMYRQPIRHPSTPFNNTRHHSYKIPF